MKKFSAALMMLSLGLFAAGCSGEAGDTGGTATAPVTTPAGGDDHSHADGEGHADDHDHGDGEDHGAEEATAEGSTES